MSYAYPDRSEAWAVRDVSASLTPGRLTVMIGPNAAGKSTLLRLMLGELPPTSGQVLLGGRTVGSYRPRRRAAMMALIPQRGATSVGFRVRQVVAMGQMAGGAASSSVERALEAADITDLALRHYPRLSTGQQQRVMLARALAQLPGGGGVLIADEPTSAMDLRHAREALHLLRQRAQRGAAVLVVLHDLNLALAMADHVWLMQAGRLAAEGPWDQVLTPSVLEPVYGVGLERVGDGTGERPVFRVVERDTMNA